MGLYRNKLLETFTNKLLFKILYNSSVSFYFQIYRVKLFCKHDLCARVYEQGNSQTVFQIEFSFRDSVLYHFVDRLCKSSDGLIIHTTFKTIIKLFYDLLHKENHVGNVI